jgi:hypothetical protein
MDIYAIIIRQVVRDNLPAPAAIAGCSPEKRRPTWHWSSLWCFESVPIRGFGCGKRFQAPTYMGLGLLPITTPLLIQLHSISRFYIQDLQIKPHSTACLSVARTRCALITHLWSFPSPSPSSRSHKYARLYHLRVHIMIQIAVHIPWCCTMITTPLCRE